MSWADALMTITCCHLNSQDSPNCPKPSCRDAGRELRLLTAGLWLDCLVGNSCPMVLLPSVFRPPTPRLCTGVPIIQEEEAVPLRGGVLAGQGPAPAACANGAQGAASGLCPSHDTGLGWPMSLPLRPSRMGPSLVRPSPVSLPLHLPKSNILVSEGRVSVMPHCSLL